MIDRIIEGAREAGLIADDFVLPNPSAIGQFAVECAKAKVILLRGGENQNDGVYDPMRPVLGAKYSEFVEFGCKK